jgi:hypothetical protein
MSTHSTPINLRIRNIGSHGDKMKLIENIIYIKLNQESKI